MVVPGGLPGPLLLLVPKLPLLLVVVVVVVVVADEEEKEEEEEEKEEEVLLVVADEPPSELPARPFRSLEPGEGEMAVINPLMPKIAISYLFLTFNVLETNVTSSH